jgi:hypothetical protein
MGLATCQTPALIEPDKFLGGKDQVVAIGRALAYPLGVLIDHEPHRAGGIVGVRDHAKLVGGNGAKDRLFASVTVHDVGPHQDVVEQVAELVDLAHDAVLTDLALELDVLSLIGGISKLARRRLGIDRADLAHDSPGDVLKLGELDELLSPLLDLGIGENVVDRLGKVRVPAVAVKIKTHERLALAEFLFVRAIAVAQKFGELIVGQRLDPAVGQCPEDLVEGGH